MSNQSEYVSGSWDPFFSSDPMENGFSYKMLNNARAQTFMPRTSSTSSLHNMSSTQKANALSRTGSMSSLHNMSSIQTSNAMSMAASNMSQNTMSRTASSSSLHDMSFMPRTTGPSSLPGHHGMQFMSRRASASSLHSMSSESPLGLQKMSFVIPHPPGPPTLVHVFTSPSSPMCGGGNFAMSPGPMSPATPFTAPDAFGAMHCARKSVPLDEVSRRVLHQVEFYFSDLNVATTDHLIKYMTKDPEGYVPMTVIASFKKIRTSITNTSQLSDILRHSERLIVSDDGKRVKRTEHLTESYLKDLQSRIVVAENLPEDHCHQSLMRIFTEVGSVIAIRTCPPSVPHGTAHNSDGLFHSNKLHAFVEYESVDQAEKAVLELNDVENWKNGLKVHFLVKPQVKPSPQSPQKGSQCNDVCGLSTDGSEGSEDGEQKKQQGRGKGRERIPYQPLTNRVRMMGASYSSPNLHILSNHEHHGPVKQNHVPRMPDGTKGFSMGRGKAVSARNVGV